MAPHPDSPFQMTLCVTFPVRTAGSTRLTASHSKSFSLTQLHPVAAALQHGLTPFLDSGVGSRSFHLSLTTFLSSLVYPSPDPILGYIFSLSHHQIQAHPVALIPPPRAPSHCCEVLSPPTSRALLSTVCFLLCLYV
jgi:hypothetical protein